MVPQLAVTPLVVDADWVALEPACDPVPLPEGETFTVLFPPFALPSAIGLQVMVMFPACTVLDADGEEVAFESPTVDEPVAEGLELEVASPPVVEPSVLEWALALDPELLSPLPDELAVAVAPLPVVLPFVVDEALDPELVMLADPVELGDASALEAPVVADPLLLTVTEILPPLALVLLLVEDDCVALEPPCDPPPLWLGDTMLVLSLPAAVPDAVGELLMLTLLPVTLLLEEGDEVAVELPAWDVPVAEGDEVELDEPPVVLPLVDEFALALPPLPLLVAVAPAPPVVPPVVVWAVEPEPPMAAVESANAGETPATTRPATATPASADALAPLRMVRRSNASRVKYCMRIASMNSGLRSVPAGQTLWRRYRISPNRIRRVEYKRNKQHKRSRSKADRCNLAR